MFDGQDVQRIASSFACYVKSSTDDSTPSMPLYKYSTLSSHRQCTRSEPFAALQPLPCLDDIHMAEVFKGIVIHTDTLPVMSSNDGATPELLNPFTPMAFLPPDTAYQVTIAIYVLVGSLAVLIWDIVTNLYNDYKMITQCRMNISCIVYFLSRWSCLAYLTGLTILETAPVGHCDNIRLVQSIYPIAIPMTSLLFFFRVVAMYEWNKYIVAFFSLSWLAVVGGCLTPTQGISGSNIGNTAYCINSRLEPYVSAAAIVPFVNDTLIFIATTMRLMQNTYVDTNIKNGLKVMLFGKYLPAFSKAVLQDGQAYYLTTISLNLVTAIMFYNTSIPIVYRSFIGVPNIVLMNAMACHVYRKIRFGVYRETTVLSTHELPLASDTTRGQSSGIAFGRNSALSTIPSCRIGGAQDAKLVVDVLELGRVGRSLSIDDESARGLDKSVRTGSSTLVTPV
ncbi:unnamed protein product [Cyclocybe aegerita]|uniref:Transmembrane protein n=1 Tax=Cyclocybe aegerita TaxID=1973307 RepID=A0A8S0WZ50_CYCAE|nr:unnamed protein product [Cyclocybe aegerita]